MISEDKITETFCSIDDFCKEFTPMWEKFQGIELLKIFTLVIIISTKAIRKV